ncbi:MAG: hypothetical protein IIB83_07965 [Bacteroidetes bacterium]|nr:hypothetical protein [Bacteroidota bacterium]
MKRLLIFSFLIVGLLYIGCSDYSTIVSPTNSDLTQNDVQSSVPTLIKLPIISIGKTTKVTSKIYGAEGGTIEIKGKLKGGIKFVGKLEIPAGAFKGTLNFTIELDKKYAGFNFGPEGATFDKPLLFSGKIEGLNLDGFDPNTLQFGFFNNGNFEPAVYENVKVDIEDGKLEVKKAQLNHFSRYNWAK